MIRKTALYELQYIAIWPVVRFVGVVSLFLSILLSMVVLTVMTVIMGGMSMLTQEIGMIPGDSLGISSGLPGFLVLSLFSSVAQAVILTISAAILVILYNLLAGLLGGVQVRLRVVPEPAQADVPFSTTTSHPPESHKPTGEPPSSSHE